MVDTASPRESLLARQVLHEAKVSCSSALWERVKNGDTKQRFHALMALAVFDPGNQEQWSSHAGFVVQQILDADETYFEALSKAFDPVRDALRAALLAEYRKASPMTGKRAAVILARHYSSDSGMLQHLLRTADGRQFKALDSVLGENWNALRVDLLLAIKQTTPDRSSLSAETGGMKTRQEVQDQLDAHAYYRGERGGSYSEIWHRR